MAIATIDATQDYDMIQTLTFSSASGTCKIRLYRGSVSAYTGTVYYRNGTSGAWTTLSVSGTSKTFPVGDTTMQVAHDWNKSGNNYMTCSFQEQSTNLTKIKMSQKAVLSGTIGSYFMYYFARNCSALTELDVPDTSSITSVGDNFMYSYASICTSLTLLSVPDTSSITSVGDAFMYYYANSCTSLTSLSVPDTSSITSVGVAFISNYARSCTSLTSLSVPDTSSITSVGNNFMSSYANSCTSLTSLSVPDTSSITSVGSNFMLNYANSCSSLTKLELGKVGYFASNNIDWSVPSGRLGYLKGYVKNATDLSDWQALTTSGNTLYTNYIQSSGDVILESGFNFHLARRKLL